MSRLGSARVFATWALILISAPTSFALPGFCFWDGGGGADDLWTTPANWDSAPPSVPGPSDLAVFKLGPAADYTVQLPGNNVLLPPQNYPLGGIHVGSNTVHFVRHPDLFSKFTLQSIGASESDRALVVGQGAGDRAVLNTDIPIWAPSAIIGDQAGAQGTLNLTANLTLSGQGADPRELIIGNHGNGVVNVQDGTLRLARPGAIISIGRHPQSTSRLSVAGPNSMLVLPSVTSQVIIGDNPSSATMALSNGAQATVAGLVVVGRGLGPSQLNLTNPGTSMTAGAITIGESGSGSLSINNGAQLTTGAAHIGRWQGSQGFVQLQGIGSRWTVNGSITLGQTEIGPIPITDVFIATGATLSVAGDVISTYGFDRLHLVGGTLDLQNHSITGKVAASLQSGTLRNLAQFNNGAVLPKTGNGILTIDGINTYTGPTEVRAGTLRVAGSISQSERVEVTSAIFEAASTQSVKSLSLNNAALARISPGAGKVLTTGGLAIAGAPDNWSAQLDITDNEMIIQTQGGPGRAATYARVLNQVKSGLAEASGAFWFGNGITSSSAAVDSGGIRTAVAVMLNDYAAAGLPPGPIYPTFSGQPATQNDILLKYTYFGDADLSGLVDGTDYYLIDQAFSTSQLNGGWLNGDFNYDGKVDGTDYFLIDNTFGTQGAALSGIVSLLPEPSTSIASLLLAATFHRRPARRPRNRPK